MTWKITFSVHDDAVYLDEWLVDGEDKPGYSGQTVLPIDSTLSLTPPPPSPHPLRPASAHPPPTFFPF